VSISPQELLDRLERDAGNVGICSHSGEVMSDDIFVALGEGVSYVQQALDQGAIAVVCQADSEVPTGLHESDGVYRVEDIDRYITELLALVYADDLANVQLIGITGTNGKTSSAHFTGQLFKQLGVKAGYIGTLGYGVVDESLHASRNTTPDRISLHRYISMLRRSGCEKIVMEVSSHAIVLGRIQGLEYEIGVFTNLSRDHLDFHLNMQSYEKAKLSFFSDYKINQFVVNADDATGARLISQRAEDGRGKLCGYGQGDSQLENYLHYSVTRGGDCVTACYQGAEYEFCINVNGHFNIENMMAAVLCCHLSGYAFAQIAGVVSRVGPVPGRLECVVTSGESKACVDYAHTPAGMVAALDDVSLLPVRSSDTWCVFGCGGERDIGKRAEMGLAASTHADHVIITDDNVRGDRAEAILCDIISGIENKNKLVICRDRGMAIVHAMQMAAERDLILVLGKGDESFVDYGKHRVEHRDMGVVMQGMAH